jgi:hypothetical protein
MQGMKRTMLKKVFESNAQELFVYISEMEERLFDVSNTVFEGFGHEQPIEKSSTPEERSEQLKEMVLSLADDGLEAFYVTQYAKVRLDVDPDRVLRYCDLSDSEWDKKTEGWVEMYRDNDYNDFTDAELIENHIENAFGVDQSEFENEVVFWDSEKSANVLGRCFGGDSFDDEYQVFQGFDTAHSALEKFVELEIN